jgi:hypothetical protein
MRLTTPNLVLASGLSPNKNIGVEPQMQPGHTEPQHQQ